MPRLPTRDRDSLAGPVFAGPFAGQPLAQLGRRVGERVPRHRRRDQHLARQLGHRVLFHFNDLDGIGRLVGGDLQHSPPVAQRKLDDGVRALSRGIAETAAGIQRHAFRAGADLQPGNLADRALCRTRRARPDPINVTARMRSSGDSRTRAGLPATGIRCTIRWSSQSMTATTLASRVATNIRRP